MTVLEDLWYGNIRPVETYIEGTVVIIELVNFAKEKNLYQYL